MASEVVANTGLQREKGFHYFIDGTGSVVKMNRATKERSIAVQNAVVPEKGFIYSLGPNGTVLRTARVPRQKKPAAVPPPPSTPAPVAV